MPIINAQARIVGITPDPTPTTQFTWTVQIRFQAANCPSGKARAIDDQFQIVSVGGEATITFPRFRGGELTLIVSADFSTDELISQTRGLKIRGTNPLRSELNAALGSLTLQKMAAHESSQRQFRAAANGGASECPLFSGDRQGGVGLFQITNPAPTDDEHWNWKANCERGQAIFLEKRGVASRYPARVRKRQGFIDLVDRYNLTSPDLPPLTVASLPDFDPEQLELDTIRGYNGWAGRDPFGMELHEFSVPLDAAGNLVVNVDPITGVGSIDWRRIPATERPSRIGDPDYVNHVLAETP
ncbi:MAG TPA: hypothetical protein VJ302_32690 [Blastocatellia bacterium]|nr:hypothetical protein [Blastocatellia bacterium]